MHLNIYNIQAQVLCKLLASSKRVVYEFLWHGGNYEEMLYLYEGFMYICPYHLLKEYTFLLVGIYIQAWHDELYSIPLTREVRRQVIARVLL